jgi:hypothetical protein
MIAATAVTRPATTRTAATGAEEVPAEGVRAEGVADVEVRAGQVRAAAVRRWFVAYWLMFVWCGMRSLSFVQCCTLNRPAVRGCACGHGTAHRRVLLTCTHHVGCVPSIYQSKTAWRVCCFIAAASI